MERIISLSDVRKAVEDACRQFSSINDGAVYSELKDVDTSKFGIAVTLADGTTIECGDTEVAAPIGAIAKIPLATILLSQNTPQELIKKSGACPMDGEKKKVEIGVHGRKGIRAVSAIEPVGDPDSKWNFIENRMIDMMGSAPTLDDSLYEAKKAAITINDEVNKLAAADFYLYDDAYQSIDLYRRAQSMKASAKQLAMMGATIAADGVNPASGKIVFDGAISARIVGMMAAKGPRHMTLPWDVMAGLPAKSSFGGLIVGVLPGVMSIAAYSPLLMPNRVSVRGAKAIITIMNTLGLSAFQSATTVIDTTK